MLSWTLRDAIPWLATAVGVGVFAAWVHRLVGTPAHKADDHDRYAEAQKLLHELLHVSRRLSKGLDPVVLAGSLLHDGLVRAADSRAELLVRTEGGVFETLARRNGGLAPDAESDPTVARCWMTGAVARSGARYTFPLRVGTRMVGVVAFDAATELPAQDSRSLQQLLDERTLPLDTALLFDEIRRLATAEERHRLAREIHDGVAQEIASLGYLVDDLALAPDDVRGVRVDELRAGLTRVVDDLRLSIFALRSDVNRATGLGLVLSEYLREVGLRSTLDVHLAIDETSHRLPPGAEEELLRIVQEAVTNARKHAGAQHLWVTCHVAPPETELIVDDDGTGIARQRRGGFGLSIMKERAERIGATLSVLSRPGGGTRVVVRLPAAGGALTPNTQDDAALCSERLHDDSVQEVTHG